MLSLSNLWMFISVVVGVLMANLCMVGWGCSSPRRPWIGLRQIQDVEIGSSVATVYVVSIVVCVTEVIRGNQPVLSLVGLPIPLLLVRWLLRTASRTRVPRKS